MLPTRIHGSAGKSRVHDPGIPPASRLFSAQKKATPPTQGLHSVAGHETHAGQHNRNTHRIQLWKDSELEVPRHEHNTTHSLQVIPRDSLMFCEVFDEEIRWPTQPGYVQAPSPHQKTHNH